MPLNVVLCIVGAVVALQVINSSALQLEKAFEPMDVTLLPMVTEVSPLQPEKDC